MDQAKLEKSFLYWKRTSLMLVSFILMPAAVTAFFTMIFLPIVWIYTFGP